MRQELKLMLFRMQKYKVFINDKWIFFGEFIRDQSSENEGYDVLDISDRLIFNLAEMIKAGSFDRNIILQAQTGVEDSFNLFLNQFVVLEAAGGIVQHSSKAYLLIKRFAVWDFPKGKIEKGESKTKAALREVQEETGVENLQIMKELQTVYHIYRFGRDWIIKKTFWYLMQTDFDGELKPQKEEYILEAIWANEAEIENYLSDTYASLKELALSSGIIGTGKG